MTGRENLRLLASIDRIGPRRVDEMLDVLINRLGLVGRQIDAHELDRLAERHVSEAEIGVAAGRRVEGCVLYGEIHKRLAGVTRTGQIRMKLRLTLN